MKCAPEDHVYRNGYYIGSDAEFACLIRGQAATGAELDDEPTVGAHRRRHLHLLPADEARAPTHG